MSWLKSLLGLQPQSDEKKKPAPVPDADRKPGWAIGNGASAFYLRVFATTDRVPSLGLAMEFLRSREILLRPESPHTDLDTGRWSDVRLLSSAGPSLHLSCSRDEGTPDCLLKLELSEFLRRMTKGGVTGAKRKVVRHLENTKVIYACKLPPGRNSPETVAEGLALMGFFEGRCQGIMQVDGEGFYERNKALVNTRNIKQGQGKK